MNGQELTPEQEDEIFRYWEITGLTYLQVAKHFTDFDVSKKRVESICNKKITDRMTTYAFEKQKSR